MYIKIASLFMSLFLLSACSDNATVTLIEKNLPKEKITCIKLVVFPPDEKLQASLEKLYDFSNECSIKLEVSTKSGITCNSKYNFDIKAVKGFPTSYLKMQVNNKSSIVYGYYIDLKKSVTMQDIEEAFFRLKDDLEIE